MPYQIEDDPDDEDWYDDEDEPDDEESVACPECGGPVEIVASKCPACGYWLSDADRRRMWTSESKPLWLRVTAAVVLAAMLLSLFAYGMAFF
jgi:hypothetical protein